MSSEGVESVDRWNGGHKAPRLIGGWGQRSDREADGTHCEHVDDTSDRLDQSDRVGFIQWSGSGLQDMNEHKQIFN